MAIALNASMKSFSLATSDLKFILRQVNFQPLDATGHVVAPAVDPDGSPLPGVFVVDPVTGAIAVTVELPDGSTVQYSYDSVLDPSGLRSLNGAFNNLVDGQHAFGVTGSAFVRSLPLGYGGYLGQRLPATGEVDSIAHPFASALDPAKHAFGGTTIQAAPDYSVSADAGGTPIVHTVVDYTPRMVSQTIASQAALDSSHAGTGVDPYDGASLVGNLATEAGAASYSGWFVLFGQFFDHGLDLIDKGGDVDQLTGRSARIIVPLAESDPLYALAPNHQLVISRATVESVGADGAPEYTNHTSPFIDQNQTYGSVSAVTDLLREWVEDPNHPGSFIPGMRLLDGHSLATEWRRWDGVETDQTLPTLTELRIAVHETLNASLGRTDLTYADVLDYHGTGQALLIDVKPTAGVIDTTSDLNVFGDGPNLLKGIDLNTLLVLAPEDPADPESPTLVLGVKPGADPQLANEAMLQALGAHYVAGDGRANENFGLTSIHHVFHEEHNFQVDNLTDAMQRALSSGDYTVEQVHAWQTAVVGADGQVLVDGLGNYVDAAGAISWDQYRLFDSAKLVVEMEYQHIAIDQYARFVTPDLPEFEAYNATKDASLSLEYSHAAFRFGHSQLRETIDAIDPAGGITGQVIRYALAESFLSPEKFAEIGPGAIALGMSHQLGNETDEFVTPALQQSLLGQPMDLPAINIARGRDIGLPTLNQARAAISAALAESEYPLSGNLTPYASWADFAGNLLHPGSLVNFIAAYSFDGDLAAAAAAMNDSAFMNGGDQGFQKIDLWIGGLAEAHVDGGILGATFNAIFVDQLERLMDGDRFYYIFRLDSALPSTTSLGNQVFTEQFKDLVERTTGVTHLTGDIFLHADSYVELGQALGDAEGLPVGVRSTGGRSEAAEGTRVTHGGKTYVLDVRPNGPVGADGVTPVAGFDAHEVIGGTDYDDDVSGGGGVDTLYGDGGDDRLSSGAGDDHVYGGQGNDTINGAAGEDLLDGEDGDDRIYAGSRTTDGDVILGGRGDDRLFGADGDDEMFGNEDDDALLGGAGDDLIYGDAGDDVIQGGPGDDTIDGGDGRDTVRYDEALKGVRVDVSVSDVQATGGGGADKLLHIENLVGSAFADRLAGDDARNMLAGGLGDDRLYGRGGDDSLQGGGGADRLAGEAGDDTLRGGLGSDTLLGGDGNDRLAGEGGADVMTGGGGDDMYWVDSRLDQVVESRATGGRDVVRSSISYALGANLESLVLTGSAAIDGTGNEIANLLIGNDGNNVLAGGGGGDRLRGGLGVDTFVLDVAASGAEWDSVVDFVSGQDRLQLAVAAFPALGAFGQGRLGGAELAFGAAATATTDHLIYNSANGALFYDGDGVGGAAQVQIAWLAGHPSLLARDIVLV